MNKTSILVMIGHYLPGYRAGGPTRTISNLITWLGDEFRFRILTRDRDLGDKKPYEGIERDVWLQLGKAEVMYVSPDWQRFAAWRRLLNGLEYDVLYLNSFFDTLSVQSVVLRRLGLTPSRPIVIAPRGEFSEGALALKATKKRLYMSAAGLVHLYREVCWQASSEHEAADIARAFQSQGSGSSHIHIAPNLPPELHLEDSQKPRLVKMPGQARVVFIARIVRMKNLDYALRALAQVKGEIDFDLYGPAEDQSYWHECQQLIDSLPSNVRTRFMGPIPSHHVRKALATAHLLFLPTLGENFGHAILEALSAGCPVLISDRTPWRDLSVHKAGWDIPLQQMEQFIATLDAVTAMSGVEWMTYSEGAQRLARTYSTNTAHLEANRRLFLDAQKDCRR